MSKLRTRDWLLSNNQFSEVNNSFEVPLANTRKKAKTVSVVSGKGGVGKTSISLKMGRDLAARGYKTLVIDCDYNLANTAVKLGLRVDDNFYDFVNGVKSFEECLHTEELFHLFTGCNGHVQLEEQDIALERIVLDTLSYCEDKYDYILLDCPAGISKDVLAIGAFTDMRLVVINPDVSSITDAYSLMKLLSTKHSSTDFSLLINKVSSSKKSKKIVETMMDTVDRFLDCRLEVLGQLPLGNVPVDQFDRHFLQGENISLEKEMNKIIKRFTEKEMDIGSLFSSREEIPVVQRSVYEHDVRATI